MKVNQSIGFYLTSWQAHSLSLESYSDQITAQEKLIHAIENYRQWQIGEEAQRVQAHSVQNFGNSSLHYIGGEGPALLLIPSIINSSLVFDIPDNSFIAFFLRNGFSVYVFEWIGDEDENASITITMLLENLQSASKSLGAHYAIGYCLGGTLSVLAELPNCEKLILIGAPWQFQHDASAIGRIAQSLKTPSNHRFIEKTLTSYHKFPGILLDYFFAMLNPLQYVQKFSQKENVQSKSFCAVEDWLISTRDLPLPIAQTVILDWFGEDNLVNSDFSTDTKILSVSGSKDHICPQESARALRQNAPNARFLSLDSGHLGLLIGKKNQSNLWLKFIDELKS